MKDETRLFLGVAFFVVAGIAIIVAYSMAMGFWNYLLVTVVTGLVLGALALLNSKVIFAAPHRIIAQSAMMFVLCSFYMEPELNLALTSMFIGLNVLNHQWMKWVRLVGL